jgi:phenol 2-monooxygenase (NADPH)
MAMIVLTQPIDLHKVFIDDESYNSGHGRAYEKYGVDMNKGAVAIVRPDHCT